MTMSEREKRAWSWAGKVAVVVLPAAIGSFGSYKKSQVEAEAQGAATYTALRLAFEAQQKDFESQKKELEETKHQVFALEGEVRMVREALKVVFTDLQKHEDWPPAVAVKPPTGDHPRLPTSAITAADAGTPDAGVDGDGIPEPLDIRSVAKSRAKAILLPKNYDDMVQQYAPKK